MCVRFGFKYSFIDNVKMKFMSLEESWGGAYNAGMLLGEGGSKRAASGCESI